MYQWPIYRLVSIMTSIETKNNEQNKQPDKTLNDKT